MNMRRLITIVETTISSSKRDEHTSAVVTDASAFAAWFAGSKIVDARGEPLKLYHGTSKDQDFRAFRMPKNGIWFTTDPKSASDYATDNDSKGIKYDDESRTYRDVHTASRVIPCFVRATKVMHWTDWPDEIKYAQNYRRAQGILFDKLRWQGYDAVQFNDSVYVVIGSPNQIKSAIGNKGTFDATKKNIDETVT